MVGINITGKLTDKFEQDLFKKWWDSNGESMKLTSSQFREITKLMTNPRLRPVTFANGQAGYGAVISLDHSKKYDYSIGTASIYFDSNKNPIGFIDFYDFDAGNRPVISEFITRALGLFGNVFGANNYWIYYGEIGPPL